MRRKDKYSHSACRGFQSFFCFYSLIVTQTDICTTGIIVSKLNSSILTRLSSSGPSPLFLPILFFVLFSSHSPSSLHFDHPLRPSLPCHHESNYEESWRQLSFVHAGFGSCRPNLVSYCCCSARHQHSCTNDLSKYEVRELKPTLQSILN